MRWMDVHGTHALIRKCWQKNAGGNVGGIFVCVCCVHQSMSDTARLHRISMDMCVCLRVCVAITNNVLSRDVSNQVNTRGFVIYVRLCASLLSILRASACVLSNPHRLCTQFVYARSHIRECVSTHSPSVPSGEMRPRRFVSVSWFFNFTRFTSPPAKGLYSTSDGSNKRRVNEGGDRVWEIRWVVGFSSSTCVHRRRRRYCLLLLLFSGTIRVNRRAS